MTGRLRGAWAWGRDRSMGQRPTWRSLSVLGLVLAVALAALLVDGYRSAKLHLDEGSVWAEPRLDDAVRQMHTVFENPGLRTARAERGCQYIRTHFAPEVVGGLMRERLELVLSLQRRNSGIPTATG